MISNGTEYDPSKKLPSSFPKTFPVKDDKSKFDVKLFVDVLLNRLVEYSKASPDPKYSKAYFLTSELKKKINVKSLDYRALFEGYLINLRAIMRGETVWPFKN